MKVVLIGDSIRGGYQPLVIDKCKVAEIWGPKENCEHSVKVVDHFIPWVEDQKPDIVHFNFGLHDVSVQLDGTHKIILEQYKLCLQRFIDKVKGLGGTRMIWATTTPLYQPEQGVPMDQWKEVGIAEVDRYNAAALKIVQREQIPVNDLHEVILRNDFSKCVCEDGCHMAPFGNEVLSDAVVEAIRKTARDQTSTPEPGPRKEPPRFWTT